MGSVYKRKDCDDYTISWCVSPHVRKEERACGDLEASKALLRKREGDAMLRRKGVIDVKAERYAAEELKPLSAHVEDFAAALGA